MVRFGRHFTGRGQPLTGVQALLTKPSNPLAEATPGPRSAKLAAARALQSRAKNKNASGPGSGARKTPAAVKKGAPQPPKGQAASDASTSSPGSSGGTPPERLKAAKASHRKRRRKKTVPSGPTTEAVVEKAMAALLPGLVDSVAAAVAARFDASSNKLGASSDESKYPSSDEESVHSQNYTEASDRLRAWDEGKVTLTSSEVKVYRSIIARWKASGKAVPRRSESGTQSPPGGGDRNAQLLRDWEDGLVSLSKDDITRLQQLQGTTGSKVDPFPPTSFPPGHNRSLLDVSVEGLTDDYRSILQLSVGKANETKRARHKAELKKALESENTFFAWIRDNGALSESHKDFRTFQTMFYQAKELGILRDWAAAKSYLTQAWVDKAKFPDHSWESIIGFPPSDGSGDYLAIIPQGRLNRILLEAKKEEKKEGKRNRDHPNFPGQPTQYIGRAKASGEFTEHCKHHNSFFKPGHVCYKKDKGNGPWRRP